MKIEAVTHTSSSADEEVVLNSGRVDTGKVDVDKTLALLDEALGGQLFQDMEKDLSNSLPDDEIITVQQSKPENVDRLVADSADRLSVSSGDVRAFSTKVQSRKANKNWLSKLAAKLPKIAS